MWIFKEQLIRQRKLEQAWWPGLILAIIAVVGPLILIVGEDFWWHMKIGEWIRANGQIPRTGIFSATRGSAPFFYQSWLSEWLLAQLYSVGGLAAIVMVRNGLLIIAYGLVGWHALRRTLNGRAAALAMLLAAAVAFDNWNVRPQTFAWVIFTLTFVIVSEVGAERWPRRVLVVLPLLEMLWVNLHGSFILGPGLVGAAALGASIDRYRDHLEAPVYATMRALWLAVAGVSVATLVNPRGFGVLVYVWTLLTDPSSQELAKEWRSPFVTLSHPVTQLFFMVVFIAVISLIIIQFNLPARDLLIIGAFTAISLTGIRYQIWFGIVAGPIIVDAMVRRGRLALLKRTTPPGPILRGVTVLLVGLALLLQPPTRGWLPLPKQFRGNQGVLPYAELAVRSTPIQAVENLLKNPPPPGQLFHEMGYGSYIIWRAGEQLPVFADTRVELYPIAQWYEYICINNGVDWEGLLAKYRSTTLLLDIKKQEKLIAKLQASPAIWHERYRDETNVIYERDPAAPPPAGVTGECDTYFADQQ